MSNNNLDPLLDGSSIDIMASVDGYITEKTGLGLLSPASAYNRRKELDRFARFCKKNKVTFPLEINKNLLVKYLTSLKVTNGTRNTIIYVLIAYMDYLVDHELILDNLAAGLSASNVSMPESDYLIESEVALVFQGEVTNTAPRFLDRNLLLFNLLFQLCLRGSEVSGLKLEDVKLEGDDSKIFVRRKGGDKEYLPLNQDLIECFYAWYAVRDKFLGHDSEWVFLTQKGNQLSRKQIHALVKTAIKRVGLTKRKMGPHILRHSGATLLSEKGASPAEIQFLLNHKSLNSTQRYLHFSRKQLKETINLLSKKGS